MKEFTAYTFSHKLSRLSNLKSLLGIDRISWKVFSAFKPQQDSFFIGWGRKINTVKARNYARATNKHFLAVEDGFIRSVALGIHDRKPLSIVIDDLGIYYDATGTSRLENILNGENTKIPDIPPFHTLTEATSNTTNDPLDDSHLQARARDNIASIISNKLSKYNSSPDYDLGQKLKERILVVDQTAGDASIEYGLASEQSFTDMLDEACNAHPDAEIIIKIHPDVVAGKKRGHYQHIQPQKNIRLVTHDINAIHLLEQIDIVYVVSSQIGFEALMLRKRVVCFGAPFYAGWGLTDDRTPIPRRKISRSLEQVFAAAYILYPHYINPYTGEPCEIETVIEYLALQRHWFNNNSGNLYCFGFGIWKRGYVRDFLQCPWNKIIFASERTLKFHFENKALPEDKLIIWGIRDNERINKLASKHAIPMWRMEDGFLRSIGLGSDLVAPASLIVDKSGIYFDPGVPSDLEIILQETQFDKSDINRAKTLVKSIVTSGISKYNVGHNETIEHTALPGQKIILIPGQVEDDASIQLGCVNINTNKALLESVRKNNPDAYILYKPHPDVLRGNRKDSEDSISDECYDLLITHTAIATCLDIADEIHTMTSLVGFDALIRGKDVTTYGQPFYAGWGLTTDVYPMERRKRKLTLDELAAGCLIKYPRYSDKNSRSFTTPERAVDLLIAAVSGYNEGLTDTFWLKRQLFKFTQFLTGITHQ